MVDLEPLKLAFEKEGDSTRKALLKLLLDLMESGHFEHVEKMYKDGDYHTFISFWGMQSFEMVMEDYQLEKETLGKKKEEEKWCIVCALPSPSNEGVRSLTSKEKRVGDRKGKGKAVEYSLPNVKRTRVFELRKLRGVGVKIRDPDEDLGTRVSNVVPKTATVKEEPMEEDVLDLMQSPWG